MYHSFISCCRYAKFAIILILLWCHDCQSQEGQELISGGSEVTIENVPYHVGIYINSGEPEEFTQLCGGTLISTTLVVTAAHCFLDEHTGMKTNPNSYKVAAGKTYRSWNDARNPKSVQKRNVAKLTLHKRYLGWEQNLANDIAIVTLDRPVNLTGSVGLADIDWEDVWTSEQLTHESNGTVAGWGITETGRASDTLLFATLPYIDPDTCFYSLSPNLRRFVTYDKFCAGFLHRNVSVCPGDSGGGLVFYHPGTGKHFLRGIVSLAFRPAEFIGECYAQHYAGFTKVSPDTVRTLKASAEHGAGSSEGECGRRGSTATPRIVGSQGAHDAEYPWHVAVYKQKYGHWQLACGGSLISSDFVISAASCFFDVTSRQQRNSSECRISAGATKAPYNENAHLPTVQTFGISNIAFHPLFSARNMANSIAVVRLDRPALFTPTVAPVCVDWNAAFSRDLRDGSVGLVPGFRKGLDSNGDFAITLKWSKLPYVNITTCVSFTHGTIDYKLLAITNFCAGSASNDRKHGRGDEGGGFSVLHSANGRYYLRGIVVFPLSVVPGYIVMQTITTSYLGWIRDAISVVE